LTVILLKLVAGDARLAAFADRLALAQQKSAMALITYIAEDSSTILTNLIETLQEITEVRVMGSGATQAEAEHWLSLHDGHWHLAIVDLFLKEGSGLGVMTGCHKRQPYQKVVLLTNYATPEIRKRALLLGADAVFDKSSELDELLSYCIKQTEKHKKSSV
jgi:DNA-binding NarL/FixJ family response regulator